MRNAPKLKSIVLVNSTEDEDPDSNDEEVESEDDSEYNIDFENKTKP